MPNPWERDSPSAWLAVQGRGARLTQRACEDSVRVCAARAESRRAARLELDVAGREPCLCTHGRPFLRPEAAAYGTQPIGPDETLPPGSAHQQVEDAIGGRASLQIGDIPAEGCGGIHPAQQAYDLVLIEVVKAPAGDDQVYLLRLRRRAHIAEHPLNAACSGRSLTRCAQGVRVDVGADQLHVDAARLGPALAA